MAERTNYTNLDKIATNLAKAGAVAGIVGCGLGGIVANDSLMDFGFNTLMISGLAYGGYVVCRSLFKSKQEDR